jgi:hypothetical protein
MLLRSETGRDAPVKRLLNAQAFGLVRELFFKQFENGVLGDNVEISDEVEEVAVGLVGGLDVLVGLEQVRGDREDPGSEDGVGLARDVKLGRRRRVRCVRGADIIYC